MNPTVPGKEIFSVKSKLAELADVFDLQTVAILMAFQRSIRAITLPAPLALVGTWCIDC